jgi:hypothetical protein
MIKGGVYVGTRTSNPPPGKHTKELTSVGQEVVRRGTQTHAMTVVA